MDRTDTKKEIANFTKKVMESTLNAIFQKQQEQRLLTNQPSAEQRIASLKKLKFCINKREKEIFHALKRDLGKSEFEAAITEVYFIYAEIDFAIKHLRKWMRPKRVSATLTNLFTKNRILFEPKGCCLIIAPWNYPFQLLMSPLVSALAAGNSIIAKPSEYSAHTGQIIKSILDHCFPENQVYCALGNQEVSSILLTLPFDHIFFTGSTRVGKIVMKAAAQHLSSVTLELGGKSPVLIDSSADIEHAAEKVAWGKILNSGQTCIAPDYVLLPVNKEEAFISAFHTAINRFIYDIEGHIVENNYSQIINEQHYQRLKQLLQEALDDGAHLAWQGTHGTNQIFAPTLLTNVSSSSRIMQEEIFGPILPIVPYHNLDEALQVIQKKAKPLALYIFSDNKKTIQQIISKTSAGGTCVNDVVVHVSNPNLPFGGVNSSGLGSCHGFYGFKAFSHERSVMYQSFVDSTALVYPPYAEKRWIMRLLKRWI